MPRQPVAVDADPVLDVRGLSFGYRGGFRLKEVTFAVGRGRFTALLGANGAGKSTLLALLTRLFDAETGDVHIGGHDLRTQSSRALAKLGVVFQQPTLDLDLSVQQNLRYMAALHGLAGDEAERCIDMELDRLAIAQHRCDKLRTLSGGTRRRVELARALLHQPALLLLDEPTAGLDPPSRQLLVEHVHALARAGGTAVLWATHLIDEIAADDTVVILHRGHVRATGSVSEINQSTGCVCLSDSFARLIAIPLDEGSNR